LKRQVAKHLKDFLRVSNAGAEAPEDRGREQRLTSEGFRLNARLDRIEREETPSSITRHQPTGFLNINLNSSIPKANSWAGDSMINFLHLIAYSAAVGEKPEQMNSLFLLWESKIDSSIELPSWGRKKSQRFGIFVP
jgi:hypothetical protein